VKELEGVKEGGRGGRGDGFLPIPPPPPPAVTLPNFPALSPSFSNCFCPYSSCTL